MTTIQLRVDQKTKISATKILDQLGIDMSAAIKLYLRQIIINKGIPLRLVTENGFSPEQEMNILQASTDAKQGKNVTKPMPVKQALQYLADI